MSNDVAQKGGKQIFVLNSKHLTLQPGAPIVKYELFREVNQFLDNPIESTAGVPVDRDCSRIAVIVKMKQYNANCGTLKVNGFIKARGYEC